MSDWQTFCRGSKDMIPDGKVIAVVIGDGRQQKVRVEAGVGVFELTSVVLRADALKDIPDAALRAWRRNRTTHLVGFKVDQKERLVATAWIPTPGVTAVEFVSQVRRLAREADLFENQLTGADRE